VRPPVIVQLFAGPLVMPQMKSAAPVERAQGGERAIGLLHEKYSTVRVTFSPLSAIPPCLNIHTTNTGR